MTLEQLRIFVAVAEREHVTRAAEALNLTQSAVSAAVSALEARHATKLFDRIGRRIALTEAGRLFLVEARAVLARAAAAETMLADLAGLKRGHMALAASQTVANYWLPPLLHRFRAVYPGITLGLVIGNTEEVTAMIRDGSIDLGFVEGTVKDPTLEIEPVADDQLVLVTNREVAKAMKSKKLTPKDLKSLSWVFRERGSGTRAMLETALQDMGIARDDLHVILELPSNESVRAAVLDGAGATALSELVVTPLLGAGRLVAFDVDLPKRQFFALRHKGRHVSEIERAFRALIAAP